MATERITGSEEEEETEKGVGGYGNVGVPRGGVRRMTMMRDVVCEFDMR